MLLRCDLVKAIKLINRSKAREKHFLFSAGREKGSRYSLCFWEAGNCVIVANERVDETDVTLSVVDPRAPANMVAGLVWHEFYQVWLKAKMVVNVDDGDIGWEGDPALPDASTEARDAKIGDWLVFAFGQDKRLKEIRQIA